MSELPEEIVEYIISFLKNHFYNLRMTNDYRIVSF